MALQWQLTCQIKVVLAVVDQKGSISKWPIMGPILLIHLSVHPSVQCDSMPAS